MPHLPANHFDLIYHDPFSPRKHPELWTETLFRKYRRVLKPDTSTVLTYSSAAAVRQGLQQAGFNIYRHNENAQCKPGTIATLSPNETFETLPPMEQELMQSRSGTVYLDNETLSRSREEIITDRQARQAISTLPTSSYVYRKWKPAQKSY